MEEKRYPMDDLRDKYIPAKRFYEEHPEIPERLVLLLIQKKKIRYAEFREAGSSYRTLHLNPEEIIEAIRREFVE